MGIEDRKPQQASRVRQAWVALKKLRAERDAISISGTL